MKDNNGYISNVGCGDILLAYAAGYGNSLNACVNRVYNVVDGTSFKEVIYRPKSDFMST